jgi:hypothetical protein
MVAGMTYILILLTAVSSQFPGIMKLLILLRGISSGISELKIDGLSLKKTSEVLKTSEV